MISKLETNQRPVYEWLSLFEMTPDLVCIAGKDGYFRKVNPAVARTLGYSEEELYSRLISSFIHPEDQQMTNRERDSLLTGKLLLNFQNRYITKNNDTVWLEWTSLYLPEKEIVFAIAKDITVNKKREKEFAEKFNTYKQLAQHFRNRAEEDRKYLAYELHEEVAQLAASLKLHADVIREQMEEGPREWQDKINALIQIADRLVQSIRRISFFISPSMLDDLGFNETLDWICREVSTIYRIDCQYKTECRDEDWSGVIKTEAFRLVQESLSSLAELKITESVRLHLYLAGNEVMLEIESNGFPMLAEADLRHLRDLAALMGAGLEMTNEPGRECKLILSMSRHKD